ncbi:MAG: hypothetical protein AAF546_03275 [Verrucomicrobiota bacterium]
MDGETKSENGSREAQLEAFKSLVEWSKWLVGVDAGILGLLTFNDQLSEFNLFLLVVAISSLGISLTIASFLVGVLPSIILSSKSDKPLDLPGVSCLDEDYIYDFKYNRIKIRYYAFYQHLFFLVGLGALAGALMTNL